MINLFFTSITIQFTTNYTTHTNYTHLLNLLNQLHLVHQHKYFQQQPLIIQKIDQILYHVYFSLNSEACRDWKGASLSDQLKSLINGLLKFNPQQRLGQNGWNEVRSHEFCNDLDWQGLQNKTIQSPIKQQIKNYPVVPKPYKLIDAENRY